MKLFSIGFLAAVVSAQVSESACDQCAECKAECEQCVPCIEDDNREGKPILLTNKYSTISSSKLDFF